LVLDARDMDVLLERSPGIATRLREEAAKRLGGKRSAAGRDTPREELAEDVIQDGKPLAPAARSRAKSGHGRKR
jgi:hypothetical protein